MSEWEKIKKEYKELPIPTNGPHQVLEAIQRAEQKRKQRRSLISYGTVVAALMLVLLLPGVLFLNGGAKAENYSAKFDDAMVESSKNSSVSVMEKTESAQEKENPVPEAGKYDAIASNDTADNLYIMSEDEQHAFWTEYKEAISAEIVRQMQERMQNKAATYYVKSEAYPEGFEILSEEQSYYINEEGTLVFVFEAGTVAPEEQGIQEFTIPKEVAAP